MGKLSSWIINKINLQTDGLYPVLVLGLAMFTYSATQLLEGNGFLAIYLSALILGNSDFIHKRSLLRFYDGQAWLMQIVLFLSLGLLVFPSKIIPVIGIGLLIAAFLMFVARPLGVFAAFAFFKTPVRSRLFISWVGLRGGVPIVFATYPLIAGLDKSGLIFNLVFFISISSVLLQGTTLSLVAKWLGVIESSLRSELTPPKELTIQNDTKEIILTNSSDAVGKKIVDLHLPQSIHIVAIKRNAGYIPPTGSLKLLAGDRLLLLSDNEAELNEIMTKL
jgi:cell volume regulation protein A